MLNIGQRYQLLEKSSDYLGIFEIIGDIGGHNYDNRCSALLKKISPSKYYKEIRYQLPFTGETNVYWKRLHNQEVPGNIE